MVLKVALIAQETTVFYQSNTLVADSKDNAKFYIVYKPANNTKLIAYQKFSIDNFLLEKGHISNMQSLAKEGEVINYYANGNVKDITNYKDGLPSGEKTHYFNSGKVNYKISYTAAGYGYGSAETSSTKYIYCANPEGKVLLENGNGEFEEYGINEEITQKGLVKHTFADGIWKGYENGKLIFIEVYKKGNLVKGEKYEPNGNTQYYTVRNSRPSPKGGLNEFYTYIATTMYDMAQAQNHNLEGDMLVKFIVESTGEIKEVRLVKSTNNPLINAMAVDVLAKSPKWKPATQQGQPIDMAFFMPISMR